MADTPHFKFPLRFAAGALQVVEQDDDEEILDCVEVLLSTELGERQEVPDYGISDPAFRQGGADVQGILTQIALWEPRAKVSIDEDSLIDFVQTLSVKVIGRANA